MNYAEKLYMRIGVRKLKDFVTPKIIKIDTFEFPKNSTVVSFLENGDFPKSSDRLFIKSGRIKIYTNDEYKQPKYETKKTSIKVKSLIVTNKRFDDEFEYIFDKKKLLLTPVNRLTLFNYNALDSIYKYKHTSGEDVSRTMNKFSTVVSCLNSGISTERTRYVHIPLNTIIPLLKDFKKNINKSEKQIEKIFTTDLSRFLLDIYRLLHPEYRYLSAFNKLHADETNYIYFVFTYANQMTILSLQHLLSAVKEYNIVTGMNTTSSKTVSKLFLLLILRVIKTPPIAIEDIDNSGNITSNIKVIGKSDTGDYVIEDKKIEDILDSEIIDTIESTTDAEELMDSIINKEIPTETITVIDDEKIEVTEDIVKRALDERLELGDITEKSYEEHLTLLQETKFKQTDTDLNTVKIDIKDTFIKDKSTVFDKDMLEDTISVFDKQYIKEQLEQDIDNSIYALNNSGLIVTNHTKTEETSIMGTTVFHEIEVKPIKGRKTKIKLSLPKIEENGTFKISNNTYIMRKQKTDKPIRKIDTNIVSLSSFYSKLFVTKHKFKNSDRGYAIHKQLRKNTTSEDSTIKMLIYGENKTLDIELPTDYTLFGRYNKSFKFKGMYFTFDYVKRHVLVKDKQELAKIEKNKYVLLGKKGNSYIVMDMNNDIYIYLNGKYEPSTKLLDMLPIDETKLPIEFASVKILKSQVPVVLLLTYIYGFAQLLKTLKVEHSVYGITETIKLEMNEYKVKFKDKQLVFKKGKDIKLDLIMSGLLNLKDLKDIDLKTLNNKDGIINLLYAMGLNKRYSTEFKLLDSMFIDPVTKDILKLMKEPTTFRGLLLRACELLTTDFVKHPNSIDGIVIKGYDRMSGIVYKTLVDNLKKYENSQGLINNKISINPYEVINKINEDSTTMLVDDQNPIAMLKQIEDVTMTGMFGRSKETLVGGSREFHESDVGIFSESVKDSSDVGISAYLTAAPTLENTRGLVVPKDIKDLKSVNIFSTTTLLTPGNDIDDPKRANFTSIQYGHVIPLTNAYVLPIRTGYESLIADRVPEKYATKAKENGVVLSVSKDKIIVLYDNSKRETFKLNKWTTKEEAHSTYTHEMVSILKKNDRIEKNDIITYDKLFFEPDIFDSKTIVMKTGMLILTQFIDSQTTNEDSLGISNKMTKRLSTKNTKVRSIIINNETNISKLVTAGDSVNYHSKLFTMSETVTEETEGYELSKETLDILSEFKNNSPKSKMDGKIEKIVFYYNCELSEINKSLRKHVEASDILLEKYTGKVNSGYSVNGTPLIYGEIEIKIYIEGTLYMGIGDKAVLGNQLKCTVGDIISDSVVSEDGKPIEAQFSTASKDARIVNSPDVIGTATTVMTILQEAVVNDYFEL